MKKLVLYLIVILISTDSFAWGDTCTIPFQRIRFHDRINDEQKKCDKSDGKSDGIVHVSKNEEINLQVTDVITRKIDALQCFVENSPKIVGNNEKIRNLNYIEEVLRAFRTGWKSRQLNPALAPELLSVFERSLHANIDSQSIAPYIEESPLEIGNILVTIFSKNIGYAESKKILFIKYAQANPDKILTNIKPYVNESFADSLVILACQKDPVQMYSFAQAINTPVGKLIHRSSDPLVVAISKLSQTPNALFYFPFLDDILSGKQTIENIKKVVGDGNIGYDSVGYFQLLVKTEIDYYARLVKKDTPIAMFGTNGLRDVLQRKAIQHFITPINELHEQNNLNIRMRAIAPLSPQEIYYVMVMGENDIYTSSYKHSFTRLIEKLGPKPKTDDLLMSVNMDYFKKFIKMAANFNQLDTFLKLMPPKSSVTLMKAFVAKLDNADNLEDAVDVADSYSSIRDKDLLRTILDNVTLNELASIDENNEKGIVIYGLLKTIFLSLNPANNIDLTTEIGIPPIYSVDPKNLTDDSGRIIQQVFFYGDDDGKTNFNGFINSFSPKEWRIEKNEEWVTIKSLKGKKVWIYANRPLDSDKNLDDSAQVHLNNYLSKNDLAPSVVIHRGHSYWLPGTIKRMPGDAKIIVLGSCGGYKNLNRILSLCPDAHIISTKEIGKGDINRPILNYLNQTFLSGKTLQWKDMWASLTKTFSTDPSAAVRESWEDYIPPYKNLGAIFIIAYNKKIESQ
ncbi:hypothetical protein LK994_03075 [Ferruginibacter lapsinanis]|uniref:hypothetical protein n=1 Tax=Ferruginibacter lapsinanis TaxID=563172 RepID=UPI001E2C55E7|nr:hypothetical protein [Ferruginibacter lapsinanis]UEG50457.1 hypothetical protein LK994_03075 [Ferruginibacter lapsinanis]